MKSSLRQLRESAGLTQDQLAHRAGVNQGHLSRLERGTSSPTLDTMMRLAAGLRVKLSTIISAIKG